MKTGFVVAGFLPRKKDAVAVGQRRTCACAPRRGRSQGGMKVPLASVAPKVPNEAPQSEFLPEDPVSTASSDVPIAPVQEPTELTPLGGGEDGMRSFEESLQMNWDALDHFGTEGTVPDVEEEEKEEVRESVTPKRPAKSSAKRGGKRGATSASKSASEKIENDPIDGLFADEEDPSESGDSSSDVVAAVQLGGSGKKKKSDAPEEEEPELTQAEINAKEEWSTVLRWYFLQVKPGCEQSCAISIRNMGMSLEHVVISDVLVPTMQTLRLTKGGKSVKKEERLFPSYILVNMIMDKDAYNDVRSVTNVQWFMGDPNREKRKKDPYRPPVPVSDDEMSKVFEKIRLVEGENPEGKTEFRPGDRIQVISGAFADSEGVVLEVKPDLDVIRANIIVFGREASVDLTLNQVLLLESGAELRKPKKRGRKPKNFVEPDHESGAYAASPLHDTEPDNEVLTGTQATERKAQGSASDANRDPGKPESKAEVTKDILDFLDDDSGFDEAMSY